MNRKSPFWAIAAASVLFFLHARPTSGQQPGLREQIQAYRISNEKQIVAEFVQLLSLPNHASDTPDIERNAQAIAQMLERRGVAVRLLRGPGAAPLVYGELRTPGVGLTLGLYAHYDGQPVDATQWRSPPFSPVLRDASGHAMDWQGRARLDPEWRIYARSAGDDKAPIESAVAALDALRSAHVPLTVNVKFMFEGEEEVGSPHLEQILKQYPEVLEADAWLWCDGPVHQSGHMQLFFGSRGETDLEITVYGPARALHSGHYGNWAPNPIMLLTHLLDSMRDTDAKILIPGFYDDVRALSAAEREALANTPAADEQLKQELAIATPEGHGAALAEQILKPSMNLRGIAAGHLGPQAANVINTEASASIDFRLVPSQTPERVQAAVEQFIARQGWFIVHQTPDLATRRAHSRVIKLEWGSGYPAYRAAMDSPVALAVASTVEQAIGDRIIKVVSLGGSAPMYLFAGKRETPVIGVPIANHDNNQHAADENLRLQNLWDGIDIYAFLFSQLKND